MTGEGAILNTSQLYTVKYVIISPNTLTCHITDSLLLRSHQASQQTNSGRVRCCLGCLCLKLASFEIFDVCMYITAFASISSMALEIKALSFVVLENFKPGRNPVS